MHLVACGHFHSRDKDGGHTIRSASVENLTLHANFMAYRTEVVAVARWKFYVAGIGVFDLLDLCDLDLDPMTLYELDLYSLQIFPMCQYELHTSRIESCSLRDRQTDRQTRPKLYTTPLGG